MKLELSQHLIEATADGRRVEEVIGNDLPDFAESWAVEYRERAPLGAWEDVATGRAASRRANRRDLWASSIGGAAVLAAVALAASGGESVDNEVWRWLWTGLALVMAIGEMFTAGFFLLPFAIGAGAAAVLAWLGVAVLPQWLVFFGVTLFAFVYLRRFIRRQDELAPAQVGANRWANSVGLVLEDIDPVAAKGMVRIGSEEWRATASTPIPAGTQVVVHEVRGARLVVSPVE
jgi:membrane protein implicated in regulation of membrane protease activity